MTTGRLSGRQLIGLLNSYHVVYLVIEGIFRANPQNGVLEVYRKAGWQEYATGKRRYMARDIWLFMNTLQVICGIHCYHCPRETDTVHYLMALHHWWDKEYHEHKSHLQMHDIVGNRVRLYRQTLIRRIAYQLDGVGYEKSKLIDRKFNTVWELVMASEKELMEIEGIGKKLAGDIVKQLRGG